MTEDNVDPGSHTGASSALLLFCQEIIKSNPMSKPKTPTASACLLSRLSAHDRQILTSFKQTIDICVCLALFTTHTQARLTSFLRVIAADYLSITLCCSAVARIWIKCL